jgi:glycosyltransferase involved in cell wall biosynthesis
VKLLAALRRSPTGGGRLDRRRVLYVVDRIDWALGIVARELIDSLPAGWEGEIVSAAEISVDPLAAWRRSRRSSIVHYTAPYMAVAFPWLATRRRAVVSLTNATTLYSQLTQLRFGFFVAISETTAREAREWGLPVKHVCRHGGRAALLELGRARQASLRGQNPTPAIGFIGKASSDSFGSKGLDILTDSVTRLAASKTPFRLILCGEGWNDLCATLRKRDVDMENMGFLEGDNVRRFYEEIDIVLVTSRVDGGPLALVEGAVSGTPIVTTRVGLAPEIVVPGENGFICEVGDVNCLVDTLRYLCVNSAERNRMALRSAEIGIAHWGWGHDRSRVAQLYTDASRASCHSFGIAMAPSVARSVWSCVRGHCR